MIRMLQVGGDRSVDCCLVLSFCHFSDSVILSFCHSVILSLCLCLCYSVSVFLSLSLSLS